MTKAQFAEWLDHHNRRFVGIMKWIGDNQCSEAWYDALSGVELERAKSISQSMFDGSLECDGFYGGHVRTILREDARLSQVERFERVPKNVDDGSVRRTCNECSDTGCVQIYDPKYYPMIRSGVRPEQHSNWFDTIVIACSDCKIGEWKSEHGYKKFEYPMFRCRTMSVEEIESFIKYVTELESKPLDQYRMEF